MFRSKKIKFLKNKIRTLNDKASIARQISEIYRVNYHNITRKKVHPEYVKEYKALSTKKLKKINETPPDPPTEKSFYNFIVKLHPRPSLITRNYKGWNKYEKKATKLSSRAKKYEIKLKQLNGGRKNNFGFGITLKKVIRFNAMY